jgi:gliding motility-associated-like protein
VVDANGCSSPLSKEVMVINYPKFFTPNEDSYNDTWNIIGLKDPEASISIFDRHGKLIKQISPIGTGWDGNYNNKPLPSSDYWFKVTYFDDLRNKKLYLQVYRIILKEKINFTQNNNGIFINLNGVPNDKLEILYNFLLSFNI